MMVGQSTAFRSLLLHSRSRPLRLASPGTGAVCGAGQSGDYPWIRAVIEGWHLSYLATRLSALRARPVQGGPEVRGVMRGVCVTATLSSCQAFL